MCMKDSRHTRALRNQLVDELISAKCIRSLDVERAFRKVPRHFFLRNTDISEVYANKYIVTKFEDKRPVSSSSQPSLMADMLEALDIRKGMRVLEIGAGTGYNAALMAELTQDSGNIYSIDIQEDIVEQCQENLSGAGYPDIHVIHGDGGYGYRPGAPYDRIIVACQAWDIPPAWMEQLKPEGVILIPLTIKVSRGIMTIPRLVKKGDCLVSDAMVSGFFMQMEGDFSTSAAAYTLKGVVMVIDPIDHSGNPNTAIFYITIPKDIYKDVYGRAGFGQLFDSWEQRGSLNFASWQEEYAFLMIVALENAANFRAWSKDSKHGFEGSGVGVLNAKAGSAALIIRGKGDIIVYGGDTAMETLSDVVSRWEAMGRPELADFQIEVYPLDLQIVLKPNEWLVQKPSVQVVVKSALSS